MSIIIEGFDNSGKSTLAHLIGDKLNLPVYHTSFKPKTDDEHNAACNKQIRLLYDNVILDRITCISSYCYQSMINNVINYDLHLDLLRRVIKYEKRVLLIYCRPPDQVLKNMDTHVLKEYDTKEYIDKLVLHSDKIIKRYDQLITEFFEFATVYDYTSTNKKQLIKHIVNFYKGV